MAEYTERYPENVTGAFYVDEQCIICRTCFEIAPGIFQADQDEDHAFVFAQPKTAEERALAEEALEACPVEAIGSDGDES